MRASCEAILMGAANVRNDNPRLLVRSKIRRDEVISRCRCAGSVRIWAPTACLG